MLLSEISAILKNETSLENVAHGDLDALVSQYPFSSTLRLLQSNRRIEASSVDHLDHLSLTSCSSYPRLVINKLFSFPVKEKEEKEPEHKTQIDKNDPVDEISEQTVDFQETSKDKVNTIALQEASSQIIPELHHLSDYSSWLLQLKQSEQSKEEVIDKSKDLPIVPKAVEKKTDLIKTDKSSELNKEIVSESLANLLADQGHYKKARAMYNKLSLIIPEKSAYFAFQIEKIKGK